MTSIAESWMPYRIGKNLLRKPAAAESKLTIEQLAERGIVERTRKSCSFERGKLRDYRKLETLENTITHVQENDSAVIYFLKTYGLECWTVRVLKKGGA